MRTRICLLCGLISMGLAGCSSENPRVVTKLNQDAALVGEMPSNPMQGKWITSWANPQEGTMSTLFGNDAAVQHARSNAAKTPYPAGSQLSLVTWTQQEDERWFGGRIPAKPKSVEIIVFDGGPTDTSYQRYEGSPLEKVASDSGVGERTTYILSQRAAVMP